MTEEQWNKSTEEEKTAEYERCKDPLYVYNTYWQVNSKPVKPMTREEWDARITILSWRSYQLQKKKQEQKQKLNKWL